MADQRSWVVRDAKGEILAILATKEEAEREMDAQEKYFDGVAKPMAVNLEIVPLHSEWTPEDEEAAREVEEERKAERFKHHLKERLLAVLEEYEDEGEHQDGFDYWKQFATIGEAIQDFGRYLQETRN